MKFFSLNEFSYSEKASINNIDNSIPDEYINNITELVDTLLDPIREIHKQPIHISSGYRCEALNTLLKGSKTSAHCFGFAADIVSSDMKGLQDAVNQFVNENTDVKFDQIIWEKPRCGVPSWIHIGLKNRHGEQRKQIFTLV